MNISHIIRSKKVVEKVIFDMQLSVEEASKFSSYLFSVRRNRRTRDRHI